MEMFSGLLAIIGFLFLLTAVVGLIAPSLFRDRSTGNVPGRASLLGGGLGIAIALFALSGWLGPDSADAAAEQPNADLVNKQELAPTATATAPTTLPAVAESKQEQPKQVLAEETDTPCDTTKLTVGGCVMQKFDMYDGSGRAQAIIKLMQNGNYSVASHREGTKCFADVSVKGMANGNSYDTQFSCEVR